MFKIGMGAKVRDKITGFEGIVTGRAEYMTGCKQYSITSKGKKGEQGNHDWVDEDRLTVIGGTKKTKVRSPGGPQLTPKRG